MRARSLARLPASGLVLCLLVQACGEERAPAVPAAPQRLTPAEAEGLLAAREAREAQRPASTPAAGERGAERPAPAEERLTIGARLLDERARPLAGATLAWIEPGEGGRSTTRAEARAEPSGAVWLLVPRSELPAEGPLQLCASAPGGARQLLTLERARWERAAVVSLGELLLARPR